jgi:hypothetical protein
MQTTSFIRNSVFVLSLSLASTCFGDTIALASGAGETKNNSSSATIDIPANPQWAAAFAGTSWVSNVESGNPSAPGYVSPANGTAVTFTDTFTINGTPILGSLLVMADDTTTVSVNGIRLAGAAPTTNNTYKTCSDFTIGCTAATTGSFNLLGDLHSGTNTLSFTVTQLAGVSFGLDYSAVIESNSNCAATPEPGTLALLGLPLAAFGFLRRRKAQA